MRSARIPLLSPPDPRLSCYFDGMRVFPEDVEPRRLRSPAEQEDVVEDVLVVDASPLWVCLLFPLYDRPATVRFRPELGWRTRSSWLEKALRSVVLHFWGRVFALRPSRERRLRACFLVAHAASTVAVLVALLRWSRVRKVRSAALACAAVLAPHLASCWTRRSAGETWELRVRAGA